PRRVPLAFPTRRSSDLRPPCHPARPLRRPTRGQPSLFPFPSTSPDYQLTRTTPASPHWFQRTGWIRCTAGSLGREVLGHDLARRFIQLFQRLLVDGCVRMHAVVA